MKPAILGAEPSADAQGAASIAAEPDLIRAARHAAVAAALLLSKTGWPLLTIATERRRSKRRTRILYWSNRFELGTELNDRSFVDPTLSEALALLRREGGEVALHLSRRWPPNAVPSVIGIVTDGVGVAVSGDHPSALSPEWLTDHVTDRARVSTLLPFGGRGAWTLLARSASAHMLQ